MRIGVIAALEEEGDAFFHGRGEAGQCGNLPVRRLHESGHQLTVAVPGIGKVNAAMAATLLAVVERATLLLVIGSAGKLSARAGGCFWIDSAVQHDYAAERSSGFEHYTAGSWPIGPATMVPFRAVADPGLGLPHARVASGDAFIECPDHARFLSEGLSADLVEMETAAVAQVADRFGISWAGVRAVSDGANGESVGDFQSNLRRAARDAGDAAERLVQLLP